jgi:4'-phosphopantetheinyl transferase EntD
MPDPNNLVITTLAKGATAQLRELVEHADKDAALPIYRELKRLAAQMARKHGFGDGREIGREVIASSDGSPAGVVTTFRR